LGWRFLKEFRHSITSQESTRAKFTNPTVNDNAISYLGLLFGYGATGLDGNAYRPSRQRSEHSFLS
jgi:hypothetical protein